MPSATFVQQYVIAILLVCLAAAPAFAQTSAFSYQGRLTENGSPAAGSFDFEFRLFNEAGVQQGPVVFRDNVTVADGTFTVLLDFGTAPFSTAAATALEVWVRPGGSTGGFQQLLPRHPVSASPYAVRSVSAASADTATSATTAANATNATNATQLGGIAASQYVQTTDVRLSDARPPTAGSASYVQNTTSAQTGSLNLTGSGVFGGALTALGNVAIGMSSADRRLSVSGGPSWSTSLWTASIGLDNFAAIGWRPNEHGWRHGLAQASNGLYFFRTTGDPGTISQPSFTHLIIHNDGRVSMGSFLPPTYQLQIDSAGSSWTVENWSATVGLLNGAAIGWRANDSGVRFGIGQGSLGLDFFITNVDPGAAGGTIGKPLSIRNDGTVFAAQFGFNPSGAGATPVCRNGAGLLAFCSSSLRYKTSVEPLTEGLHVVMRLRPIAFTWKETGVRDLGFAAEEVARVSPLLAVNNDGGEIEGVNSGPLTAVIVKAVQEQQAQIEQQRTVIERLDEQHANLNARLVDALARIADLERRMSASAEVSGR